MLDAMNLNRGTLAGFDGFLLDLSLKATVILLSTLLVVAILRRHSAAFRHAVLTLGMTALLLLPVLTAMLPTWQVAIPISTANELVTATNAVEVEAIRINDVPKTSLSEQNQTIHSAIPLNDHGLQPAKNLTEPSPADKRNLSLLAVLWATGASFVVFTTILGFAKTWRLRAISTKIRDKGWLNEFESLTSSNQKLRHVQLFENPAVSVPIMCSLLSPTVILPTGYRPSNPMDRRRILIHELAHIQRHDLAVHLVARIICSLYWFHPLTWWCFRSMQREREYACDDRVLSDGEFASEYAQQLLSLAQECYRVHTPLAGTIGIVTRTSLERRIVHLVSSQSRRSPVKSVELVCAVVIGLLITTGIAAIQPQIAQVSDANSQENSAKKSVEQESAVARAIASKSVGEPTLVQESAGAPVLIPIDAGDSRLLKTLNGHTGIIYSVAFSLDGKILASGDENGAIKLWGASTGKNVNTFITPRSQFNPDEKILIRSLAFSPDSTVLATGNTGSTTFGTIRLWDVSSGQNLVTFDGSDPPSLLRGIYSLAFSPDGKTLASGHEDNLIRIWNASNGNILTTFEADADDTVYTVAYSPKGESLASAGPKGIIKLWDVASGKSTATFKAGGPGFKPGRLATPVYSVTFSSDGRLGAGCWSKGGLLWDVAGGRAATFGGKRMSSYSVAFSPDAKTFAMGYSNGKIELWDTTSRKRMAILAGHTALVRCLDFHPDGTTLASASDDSSVKLWKVN